MNPIPSTISKILTLADQTVRIQLDCQEIPAETISELFSLRGGIGFFHFKEKPELIVEVPDIKLEQWEKSPSQRLRACLYRLWENSNSDQDFEVYYRSKMENIIEQVKDKI